MLKKFFAAVILSLLIFSSSTAAAEDADWNSAPRIADKAELARYVESERRKGHTVFRVILVNGFTNEDPNEFLNLALAPRVDMTWSYPSDGTERVTYTITEYPGTRVANAYLNGDTGNLTPDELKLYNAAVDIVNAAKKYSAPIDQERYLHDAICARAIFKSHKNEDAAGALIKGKTNCQGYADAFYMLGRMCGFNVGRMQGTGDGEAHAWNWIELDGKVYCVDVTFDDKNFFGKLNSYVYFNAPLEIMEATHSYSWEALPNLQRDIDERYPYRTFDGFAQAASAETGLKLLARKLSAENKSWFSVMTPFDKRFSEAKVQRTADYIADESGKSIRLSTWQRGKYLFFTATVK